MSFDWTTSVPHAELLSKFRAPRPLGDFRATYRMPALGEPAPAAIERFLRDGHLAPASLAQRTAALTVRDLKAALKGAGQKVSGKKAALVERLLSEAPDAAERATANMPVVHALTDQGRVLVERYREWQRQRLRAAVADATSLLNANDVNGAVARHREFAALDPWRDPADPYPEREQQAFLGRLASARPAILRSIDDANMARLRLAAALTHFFGKAGVEEMPGGYATGSHLDDETAARMMWFHINHLRRCERLAGIDGTTQLRVSICGDSGTCPECAGLDGRVFSLRDLPELPFPHCTSSLGCRCVVVMTE